MDTDRLRSLTAVAALILAAGCAVSLPIEGRDSSPADESSVHLEGLASADAETRSSTAARLGYREDPDGLLADALVAALADPDAGVRRMAAASLGTLRPPAELAIPDLLRAMEDQDAGVVSNAAYALALLGSGSLPGLRRLARHEDETTRSYARRALAKILQDARN